MLNQLSSLLLRYEGRFGGFLQMCFFLLNLSLTYPHLSGFWCSGTSSDLESKKLGFRISSALNMTLGQSLSILGNKFTKLQTTRTGLGDTEHLFSHKGSTLYQWYYFPGIYYVMAHELKVKMVQGMASTEPFLLRFSGFENPLPSHWSPASSQLKSCVFLVFLWSSLAHFQTKFKLLLLSFSGHQINQIFPPDSSFFQGA